MALAEVRIDDALWDGATPERRGEWRQAIAELMEEGVVEGGPIHLRIALDGGDTVLEARGPGGAEIHRVALPMTRLAPHFKEYFDICRDMGRLGEGSHSPRLEALDIAKRIAHDEAAETLAELVRPLRPDHATCRRLFTLLVTLHFDTTRLLLPHHRR